jgi:peptide chain release factor 1
MVTFKVSGPGSEIFQNESGLMQWQRIPPTEKKGRTQTSLISVAVLHDVEESSLKIEEKDLEWKVTNSSKKAGGQSVNTAYSCCELKHLPTQTIVRCQNERSLYQNKRYALEIMRARLMQQKADTEHATRSEDRRNQIGIGDRGNKRRTIRVKDGQVKDHLTGKTWRYEDYKNGKW